MKNIPITGEYITSQINRSARRVECAKLYETIARYGVNETVLAMYNDNNGFCKMITNLADNLIINE